MNIKTHIRNSKKHDMSDDFYLHTNDLNRRDLQAYRGKQIQAARRGAKRKFAIINNSTFGK